MRKIPKAKIDSAIDMFDIVGVTLAQIASLILSKFVPIN